MSNCIIRTSQVQVELAHEGVHSIIKKIGAKIVSVSVCVHDNSTQAMHVVIHYYLSGYREKILSRLPSIMLSHSKHRLHICICLQFLTNILLLQKLHVTGSK